MQLKHVKYPNNAFTLCALLLWMVLTHTSIQYSVAFILIVVLKDLIYSVKQKLELLLTASSVP